MIPLRMNLNAGFTAITAKEIKIGSTLTKHSDQFAHVMGARRLAYS